MAAMTPAEWYQRHKKLVLGTACGAVASYAAYRVYHSERVAKTHVQLSALAKTVAELCSTLASMGDCASLVAADLHTFLNSDSDEVPRSLGQLGKLLQSPELQGTVQAVAASVTRGAIQGAGASLDGTSTSGSTSSQPPVLDKVLDAILSDRGRSLIGMAVGIATKNATTTFCEYLQGSGAFEPAPSSDGSDTPRGTSRPPSFGPKEMLALLASEPGERLLSLLITKSMRTAISTYCEAYVGYNAYDEMLDAISRPHHQEAVSSIMARMTSAFCREAAAVYFKTTRGASSSSAAAADGAATPSASSSSLSPSASADLIRLPGPSTPTMPQQLQHQLARCVVSSKGAPSSPPPAAAAPTGSAFTTIIRQVAEVAREREIRSLAIDVACATTREATREAMAALLRPAEGSSSSALSVPQVSMYKLYVAFCALISLAMFAVSPNTLVV